MFVDLAIFVLQMQDCVSGTYDCALECDGKALADACGICDYDGTNDCVPETCDGVDLDCNSCSVTLGVRTVTNINENFQCGAGANICSGGACTGGN